MAKQPKKLSLAEKAQTLVSGDRLEDYGSARTNFTHIAMMWSATLAKKLNEPITAEEVAMLMINLKIARLTTSPGHEDSWVDVIGYAVCGGETVKIPEELPGILGES